MSLWIYRKENGKRYLWQIDVEPMLFLVGIGLLLALAGPKFVLTMPFAFVVIGFFCLLISKISIFRQGKWFSFGPAMMTKRYATLYRISYVLLAGGFLLLLLLSLSTT
jgi:hypothetical protein